MSHDRRKGGRYQFEPLANPKAEIRVLSIGLPDEDGYLECKLENRRLDDKPYYVAVSYECGDPDLEVDIKIDGKIVPIRHNLWLFLDHLLHNRRNLVEEDSFRLWADSVCIDQRNSEEKRDQISLMSRIFNQADSVFAWLAWTSKSDSQSASYSFSAFVMQFVSMEAESNVNILNKYVLGPEWSAMIRILYLSYWSRRWIVQELLLARNITLVSDTVEFPWFKLQGFFSCIESLDSSWAIRNRYSEEAKKAILNVKKSIPFKMWAWSHYTHRPPLLTSGLADVVSRFASTVCEMEHDKIYSLMSLVKDGGRLTADYQCSMSQLLCRIFTPLSPAKFDFRSLSTLARELRLTADNSKSSQQRPDFLECSFQAKDIDQVIAVSVSRDISKQLDDLAKELQRSTSCTTFHRSCLGNSLPQNPMADTFRPRNPSIENHDVLRKDLTVCISRKAYVVVCPEGTQVGDILCSMTPSTALVGRKGFNSWSITGLSFLFSYDSNTQKLERCLEFLSYPYRVESRLYKMPAREFSIADERFPFRDMSDAGLQKLLDGLPKQTTQKVLKNASNLFPNVPGPFDGKPFEETFSDGTYEHRSFSNSKFIFCSFRDCTFTDCTFSNCMLYGRNELIGTCVMNADPGELNQINERLQGQPEQNAAVNDNKTLTLYLETMEAVQLAREFG